MSRAEDLQRGACRLQLGPQELRHTTPGSTRLAR